MDEVINRLEAALDKASDSDIGSREAGATLLTCAGEALGMLRLIKEQLDAKDQ